MPIRFLSMLFPLLVLLVNVPSTLPWMLERDGVLLAYDPNNYNAETWGDWSKKVGASAIAGGIAGSAVPGVGTAIGAFFGFFGGAVVAAGEFAINKAYCQNACGSQYVVCTQSKDASMACCNSNFARTCVNNFNEVEAMFPTTTTTTTTPAPAPINPTPDINWQETAYKNGANLTCKRGRKTTKTNDIGRNVCPFESSNCYFIFCYDVKYETGHFAEWGCMPIGKPNLTISYKMEIWKCETHEQFVLDRNKDDWVGYDMSNEKETFEQHYESMREKHGKKTG